MDVDYELSQQLIGHDSHVRCVCVLSPDTIISGGLDAQVIMWKKPSADQPFEIAKTLHHHSDWVNDLAASSNLPGHFYSASKDKTAVLLDAEGNPVKQFIGHEDNVCCVVERGAQLVTSSWDGTAKVWDVATGELQHTLEAGPPRAVCCGVLPTGEIVTGAQDNSLRIFRGAEETKKIENAHSSIIRSISVGSTQIVTASNDQLLKIWSLDLCEMGTLAGHGNFVYGVAHSMDGQTLFSVGEDCTLKRWSMEDSSCQQSISHAGSVWQAAPMANGDVATCCEDKIVRIWTNNPARMATEAERQVNQEMAQNAALNAAAKGSSSTSMPEAADASEMATTVGKKNGEIKCFKEGAITFAFSWNAGGRCWDKIGEVTGGAATKKTYVGDHIFPAGEYDFVFDVEWSDKTALLPFSHGQNPMERAEWFCAREGIGKTNIDQIRKFIVANAGGTASATAAPADAPAVPKPKPPTSVVASFFPLSTPILFKDGKYDPLQKKILEFNDQVDPSVKMNDTERQNLIDAIQKLSKLGVRAEFKTVEIDVVHQKLIEWPQQFLFPVMDLWRLWTLHPSSSDFFKGSDRGAPMIAKTNRTACYTRREMILKGVAPTLQSANKNIKLAAATVLLNFAIVLHEQSYPMSTGVGKREMPWEAESAMDIAKLAFHFLETAGPEDGDAQQRAALCIGTLLPRDKEKGGGAIAAACKEAGFLAKLEPIKDKVTPKCIEELKKLLV